MDGCHNYTVLSEADRAQGHIVINASNYRNDHTDLAPGWYRFQGAAGDRMADKCVPMDHCGTQYPGWLNDTHPTVAEGVVIRRVCYSRRSKCCYQYQNIRVKNCGAYFVYALPTLYHYYYYYYFYHYYYYYRDFRYCGNGRAGKILRMFLIISLSKEGRYFSISSNAIVNDAMIDVNVRFLL